MMRWLPAATIGFAITITSCANTPETKAYVQSIEDAAIPLAVSGCVLAAATEDVPFLANLCRTAPAVIEYLLSKQKIGLERKAAAARAARARPLDDGGAP
jgi:hypothetical protein